MVLFYSKARQLRDHVCVDHHQVKNWVRVGGGGDAALGDRLGGLQLPFYAGRLFLARINMGSGVDAEGMYRALTVIEGFRHDGVLVLGQGVSWDPDIFNLLSVVVVVASVTLEFENNNERCRQGNYDTCVKVCLSTTTEG